MDKKSLNNEIVLCRSAVRKAKVAIIRKIIRRMKILKTCRVEAVKEKKLRKSERLFEKVQILKRVKLDEVTKFALRNNDLEPFLKGAKVDLQLNALACLAQHDAIAKKVNSIREKIPNWETELLNMLDSLGRKTRKKNNNKKESIKITDISGKCVESVTQKGGNCRINGKVKNTEVHPEELKAKPSGRTQEKYKTNNADREIGEESDCSSTEEKLSHSSVGEIKKIVDPFFIGKTVIAPKLELESTPRVTSKDKTSGLRKPSLKRETNNSLFHAKPFKSKKDSNKLRPQVAEEMNLHPSWAAKKVELIKPFQGKKIKFTDE